MKVVRPIQFDQRRKANRNRRAREAERRRSDERNKVYRFLYRTIEPWCDFSRDCEDRTPANDN